MYKTNIQACNNMYLNQTSSAVMFLTNIQQVPHWDKEVEMTDPLPHSATLRKFLLNVHVFSVFPIGLFRLSFLFPAMADEVDVTNSVLHWQKTLHPGEQLTLRTSKRSPCSWLSLVSCWRQGPTNRCWQSRCLFSPHRELKLMMTSFCYNTFL